LTLSVSIAYLDGVPVVNGPALATIRERSGQSQSDLSKGSGVSQGRISEIESGFLNVRPPTVKKLCDALGISQMAILEREVVAS
jgi:transcriptional regulator with XRE-family HTH domain